MDVLLRTPRLGNWFHVPDLLERLLARVDRDFGWAHERTPLANLVRWKDKPVALSIVQGRLVGLVHFTVGNVLTYAAFVIASTAGKFG